MTVSALPPQPVPWPDGRPIPPWPGAPVQLPHGSLMVRRTPAPLSAAPPAVFVHGLGGAATNWTDLMYLLRDDVVGVAPDLPGFGASAPPPDGYALDHHVRAVVELVEHERVAPVHLFGNSMGGAVAVRVAAERPELVRTLTLVSPAMPDLRPRRRSASWQLGLMMVPGVGQAASWWLARQPAANRARGVIELVFADASRVPPQRFAEAVAEVEQRRGQAWSDEALVRSLRGLVAAHLRRGPRSLWRQAEALRMPTLIVWGRHDRLVHPDVATRLATVVPGSRLLMLEHSGHVAQMEDPVAVAEAWRALVGATSSR